MSFEIFFNRCVLLDTTGRRGLGALYLLMDKYLTIGKMAEIDAFLMTVELSELSVDIILGLLINSRLAPAAQMPSYPEFFRRVEAEFMRRGLTDPGLLRGLETSRVRA